MDPTTVEAALADRAAAVHADLNVRWGDVPHSSRTIKASEYEYPESPDEVFPFVAVGFVTDGSGGSGLETSEPRVLVCRDAKHDDLVWEPPGGRGRPDESPAATAEREIREETGLEAEVRGLLATEVLRFDHGHAVMPVLQAVFVAEQVGGHLDPEPGIEPRWFSVGDPPEDTQYRDILRAALSAESR